MGDNPEECPVCMTAFDDTIQRPRTLPCGHTFCTPCMDHLNEQNTVACPTCRVVHTVPDGGQFPISYIVEAFIKRMREAGPTFLPHKDKEEADTAGRPGQMGGDRLCGDVHSLLQEQEAKVLVAITACQEVQSQLDQYQSTLGRWGDQQQQIEDRLQEVMAQNRSARLLVRHEESQVAAMKEQVQQREHLLYAVLENLHKVTTEQEADTVVLEVGLYTDEAKKRLKECREMFPNPDTAITALKVKEASTAAFEAVQNFYEDLHTAGEPFEAAAEPGFLAATNCTIRDRLQALLTPTLKVLQSRTSEA